MTDYKESGVDLKEVASLKKEIKRLAEKTYSDDVLSGVGLFGAILGPEKLGQALVLSIDGVGSKIRIARLMDSFVTLGRDLVNHSINDILSQGAEPLYFLDYIAQDKLRPNQVLEIIMGIVRACQEAKVSLVGGETAQLPGIYRDGEIDLVGVIIGKVEKQRIIDGHLIRPGDIILGLPSSGLHTNGYSLAWKVFFEKKKYSPYFYFREIGGQLGRVLLAPHRSYLKPVKAVLDHQDEIGLFWPLHGIAHITGGGLKENIERILPEGCRGLIRLGSWPVLPIFQFLQKEGEIPREEMYKVFNMGIGMVLIVPAIDAPKIYEFLWQQKEPVYEIGKIVKGNRGVDFISNDSEEEE